MSADEVATCQEEEVRGSIIAVRFQTACELLALPHDMPALHLIRQPRRDPLQREYPLTKGRRAGSTVVTIEILIPVRPWSQPKTDMFN